MSELDTLQTIHNKCERALTILTLDLNAEGTNSISGEAVKDVMEVISHDSFLRIKENADERLENRLIKQFRLFIKESSLIKKNQESLDKAIRQLMRLKIDWERILVFLNRMFIYILMGILFMNLSSGRYL